MAASTAKGSKLPAMNDSKDVEPSYQQQPRMPPQSGQPRAHRRTHSEDYGGMPTPDPMGYPQGYPQGNPQGYPQGYPQYAAPMPTQMGYAPQSNLSPNSSEFVPQGYALPPSNRRRSFSENQPPPGVNPYQYPQQPQQQQQQYQLQLQQQQQQYQQFQQHPPSPYQNGSPYPPTNHQLPLVPNSSPGLPSPSAYQQPNQRPDPRRKRKNTHRRANSYSGSSSDNPMLGDAQPMPPPPGIPPPIPNHPRAGEFSPMNEFRKLAGMKQPASPRPSPQSSARGLPPPSPSMHSSLRGIGSFPKDDARVSFSPGTPMNGIDAAAAANYPGYVGLGVYGADGSTPTINIPGVPDMGGEAVFLAQKKSKGPRKSPGSRRMHMRQQSAQLYMEDVKGTEQTPSCRDNAFLLLFLFHLLGIVYLGNNYGYEALRYHADAADDSSVTIIYRNVIYVSCLSGLFAVTVSALTLLVMTFVARKIVQIALFLTIMLSFTWGTVGIGLSPKKVVPATGIIALALSVAYAFIVWERIPFAAANLNAALSGIRANPGAVLVAFLFQTLALGWSTYYTYVCVGVYDAVEVGTLKLTDSWRIALYSMLAISYYWTFNVFLNVVQVTVAGIIGSWWFTPEGDVSNRRTHLNHAFFRASFYALGSICFGSLFIGPCRLLRQLTLFLRPSSDEASLLCLHQCFRFFQTCISSCVDSLTSRFNPWAFTYVGLYGYGLADAGKHAKELFEKRGWTTIVSDDLVPNVLLLASLVVGGITGCFAHLVVHMRSLSLSSGDDEPLLTSFMAGLAIGLVVTSVLFGIISSSVNAVIVCFASSPVDFEQNHSELSQEMRAAWREVWPGCMDVVDMRVAVATHMGSALNGPMPMLVPLGEQQHLLAPL